MIIFFFFQMAHTTLISQKYSIHNQEYALLHLSIIKQFTPYYLFGDLQFNLSLQANHQYTLLYIPDSSSAEYHCVVVLKQYYQDCFKENIYVEDDEYKCQEIVTSYLKQNIYGNQSQVSFLICDGFQNLTISNFNYRVQITQPDKLITPALIIFNRYDTSKEGLQVNFQMNFQYDSNKADYEAVIILGIILVLILLIFSFILFILCNRHKEIKKQIKYQDNVYKKIKEKSN